MERTRGPQTTGAAFRGCPANLPHPDSYDSVYSDRSEIIVKLLLTRPSTHLSPLHAPTISTSRQRGSRFSSRHSRTHFAGPAWGTDHLDLVEFSPSRPTRSDSYQSSPKYEPNSRAAEQPPPEQTRPQSGINLSHSITRARSVLVRVRDKTARDRFSFRPKSMLQL
ncbi:hypothetical protein PEBR_08664 [Penicillium brasilianum]|uniref:Uncharacterized protein n=1 Tax=Penicillium brasilianum TaxID=104259 RepID=A0A1S9S1B1_PENBI|nr:hypothetical protein PEBR_08664 [Penicillium brasilianum]